MGWTSARRTVFITRSTNLPASSPISNLLQNVRDVIESTIIQPYWGLAKLYKSEVLSPDTAYFFIDGPEIRAIYILLFTPKTRFLIFEGSHNIKIPGKVMSEFGILTLPHEKLEVEGVKVVSHDMTKGGL